MLETKSLFMAGHLLKVRDWEQMAKAASFKPNALASLCSVSTRQLERFFKTRMGATPRRWLRNLQCHLAKELIGHGYSNKAVVAELKFSSESQFCHEFKKVFGESPQSFAPIRGQTN